MDSLLFGALCAMGVRSEKWLTISRRLIPFAAAIAFAALGLIEYGAHESFFNRAYWTASFGYTALGIGYSALLLAAFFQNGSGTALDRIFESPFLRFCGKYSYGLYVWHAPVFMIGALWFRHASWWGRSAGMATLYSIIVSCVSISVAVLSYECFEKWFLRAKPRFKASVSKTLTDPLESGDVVAQRV